MRLVVVKEVVALENRVLSTLAGCMTVKSVKRSRIEEVTYDPTPDQVRHAHELLNTVPEYISVTLLSE